MRKVRIKKNKFRANIELIEVLKKNGFKDFTSSNEKRKGKYTFKKYRNSPKAIHFDYIWVQVMNGYSNTWSKTTLTKDELKHILLYFDMNSKDYKELNSDKNFNYDKVIKKYNSLKYDLIDLIEGNLDIRAQNKIIRLLYLVNSFKIKI